MITYECHVCNKTFDNKRKFAKHRLFEHNLNLKDYYDKFLKKEKDGICVICNKCTNFNKNTNSYPKTCSHKCGGIYFRKNLKSNSKKFEIFKNKVSKHRKKWWSSLTPDELKTNLNKVKTSLNKKISKLSTEQKKEKYGFLNKLNEKEKKSFIENKMLTTGAHKWWKTATEEEKKNVYEKRTQTNIKNNNLIDRKILNIFDEYKNYKKEVQHKSNITYKKHKKEIDPNSLRGKGYQLDHIYSISTGFKNKIDPKILSIKENLRILSSFDNNSKNNKCDISKDKLLLIFKENYEIIKKQK
jgi:hypothetical protein